jgi:hypothetical protein
MGLSLSETVALQILGCLVALATCCLLNKQRWGFWLPWDLRRHSRWHILAWVTIVLGLSVSSILLRIVWP